MKARDMNCSIPQHAWLVLRVDDYMDAVDPMNIAEGRYRPHEYSPEIDDFIDMIVNDDITVARMDDVFERFFGHPLGPHAHVTAAQLVRGLHDIRTEWLAYLGRIAAEPTDD